MLYSHFTEDLLNLQGVIVKKTKKIENIIYIHIEMPVLEHIDYDVDYKCDYGCGYEFEKPAPEEPAEPEEEKNFIEKLIEWLKDFFNFDWLKKLFR